MDVAAIVMALLLGAVFLVAGGAKLAMVPYMAKAAEHQGLSRTAYRLIGALEVAAVAGLVVGLFWPPLGIAAAVGLVALMIGAAVVHRRAGDGAKEIVPPLWLGLVSAATAVVTVLAM